MDRSCVTCSSILMVTNNITKVSVSDPGLAFSFSTDISFRISGCKVQETVNVSHFELVELGVR